MFAAWRTARHARTDADEFATNIRTVLTWDGVEGVRTASTDEDKPEITGVDLLKLEKDRLTELVRTYRGERSDLRRRLRQAEQKLEADNRRYALLREYATQGLTQSRTSFRMSLYAATFGFTIIMVGVIQVLFGVPAADAAVTVVSGAVIDAVALLFFAQDRRHQATMFQFFERLREDRKLDEALDIMTTISDDEIRARVQAALVLHFAQVPDTLDVLKVADRRSGDDKSGEPEE
ncbi:TRADD-N-associated membrane domain-containing protein [Pseudonocardia alni]|uniref:TRADD-N-associated membrane domain-containing protein n=1 Tax=Pseudonocardia alni TaxID=33907 RepID=UPI0033215456